MAGDVRCSPCVVIKPWKPLQCSHGGGMMTGSQSRYRRGCWRCDVEPASGAVQGGGDVAPLGSSSAPPVEPAWGWRTGPPVNDSFYKRRWDAVFSTCPQRSHDVGLIKCRPGETMQSILLLYCLEIKTCKLHYQAQRTLGSADKNSLV